MLLELVTGRSWSTGARSVGTSGAVLRRRRDEWVGAGVFERRFAEALHADDRIVGLDSADVAIDGCLANAPPGGQGTEGTDPDPTDRAKRGWKRSLATDARGVPLGFVAAANVHDHRLLAATLDVLRPGTCPSRARWCTSTPATTTPPPDKPSPSGASRR